MPQIIIEQINDPSYKFLEWVYENDGHTDDSRSIIEPEIISECVSKGNFKFYKWLLTSFLIYFSQKKNLVLIYSYALVKYIKFTEFTLSQQTGCEEQIAHDSLTRICRTTPVDPFSCAEDVIEYVDWLIKIGRLSSLDHSVLASLVEFLMFKCDRLDKFLIVKKLLYVHMFMGKEDSKEFIKDLFRFIKFHGKTALDLINLMDESGILSSCTGREQIISLKEREISSDSLKKLKDFMIQPSHLSSFDKSMRMIHEILLLPRNYFAADSYNKVNQYFINELQRKGIIEEFGILIIQRLLIIIGELKSVPSEATRAKNCETFLEKELFEGILVSFGLNASSILEITRIILRYGSQELMSNLHSKFKSQQSYKVGINSVIRDALQEDGTSRKQLVQILKVTYSNIDLIPFYKMKCKGVMTDRDVCCAVLDVISDRQEKSSDFMDLAEHCLGVILTRWKSHAGFAELLPKYMTCVSDSILRMILGKYGVPTGTLIREKIVEYILNNRKDFIRILIEARDHSQRFQELVDIDPHPRSIYNLPNNLIMGERIYEKIDGKIFLRRVELNSRCVGCNKYLRKEAIYHDDEHSFNVYSCEKCKTSGAQALCNICFTHDSLKILQCGHCYCQECLSRFAWRETASCPVCKKPLIISTILKTTEQVLTEYWVKIQESPCEAEAAAKALLALYGSADDEQSEESGTESHVSSD